MTKDEKIKRIVAGLAARMIKNHDVLVAFLHDALVNGMPGLSSGSEQDVDLIYDSYKEKGIVK
jgi:hypothetical protein